MLYELSTLSCPLLRIAEVAEGAYAWVMESQAKGELLGSWRTELGVLGRLLVLLGFSSSADMMAERHRALLSANPFHSGHNLTSLHMEGYALFPFLSPISTGERGSMYEFRTYCLKPGGLQPTLASWEAALGPAREYTEHLVANMYALDGAPRITHTWAFSSLEERADLRARAYGADLWPPKGGPEQIMKATSTIALPQARYPCRDCSIMPQSI